MKICLLIPRSDMFPKLGNDFLNGIKYAFKSQNTIEPEFVIESIGNGTDLATVQQLEKHLLAETIDMAIGFCGKALLPSLIKLFDAYQIPFIHTDFGANYLEAFQVSDYVAHQTLNLWQSCYETGTYIANHVGKNVAIHCSYYDGGYQLIDGFFKGFIAAGGSICHTYVSPLHYNQEEFDKEMSNLNALKPDAVFGIFSYKEGAAYLQSIADSGIDKEIPFYTVPLLVDPHTIQNNIFNINNIFSVASWGLDTELESMIQLKNNYKTATNKELNVISLLAYEAGLTALSSINDKEITHTFKNKEIATPRGLIRFNEYHESQITEFQVYQLAKATNKHQNKWVTNIPNTAKNSTSLQELEEFNSNGWKNPYICT